MVRGHDLGYAITRGDVSDANTQDRWLMTQPRSCASLPRVKEPISALSGQMTRLMTDLFLCRLNSGSTRCLAVMAYAMLLLASPAFAQGPVALVEQVRGNPGVDFMDYVSPGTTIRLGRHGSIVLGYFSSCVVERISGGVVTIGQEQSEVLGGSVVRSKTSCEGGHINLTSKQANESAGTTFRAANDDPYIVHGLSPFFAATRSAALLIVRIDKPSEHFTAELVRKRGSRSAYYDCQDGKIVLTPGATYAASIGSRRILFKVDSAAKAGAVPIISRLVRFDLAS